MLPAKSYGRAQVWKAPVKWVRAEASGLGRGNLHWGRQALSAYIFCFAHAFHFSSASRRYLFSLCYSHILLLRAGISSFSYRAQAYSLMFVIKQKLAKLVFFLSIVPSIHLWYIHAYDRREEEGLPMVLSQFVLISLVSLSWVREHPYPQKVWARAGSSTGNGSRAFPYEAGEGRISRASTLGRGPFTDASEFQDIDKYCM